MLQSASGYSARDFVCGSPLDSCSVQKAEMASARGTRSAEAEGRLALQKAWGGGEACVLRQDIACAVRTAAVR